MPMITYSKYLDNTPLFFFMCCLLGFLPSYDLKFGDAQEPATSDNPYFLMQTEW